MPCLLHAAAAGRRARAPACAGGRGGLCGEQSGLSLDGTLPPAARDTLRFARDTAGTLLRKAAEHVREAKLIHDELEALCRPYVDFAAADALAERTLHELFPT